MFCCSVSTNSSKPSVLPPREHRVQRAQDAKVAAIALAGIALLLFSTAYVLYGVGTLSPTTLMGLGMVPYLVGVMLSFLGIGLLVGTFSLNCIHEVQMCALTSSGK